MNVHDIKYGGGGVDEYYGSLPGDVDPNVNPAHGIHWVLCQEVYSINRRPVIDDWVLVPEYTTEDTGCYVQEDGGCIFAFRGSTSKQDLINDVSIANGKPVQKVGPATALVQSFIWDNNTRNIQLTGHSLGGAVARHVKDALSLSCVTFNAGAPPTAPVVTGGGEVDYHICFDVISAWQSPMTIRIDKGYRPHAMQRIRSLFGKALSTLFATTVGITFLKAHALSNFSRARPGKQVPAEYENNIFQKWYGGMPLIFKKLFLKFIDVNNLSHLQSLPVIGQGPGVDSVNTGITG